MAERKRRTRQVRQKKQQPTRSEQTIIPYTDETHKDTEERLNMLDAVIDDLVSRRTTPAGQSVVAGEQQPHRTKNPLSDEVIVKRFIQTGGE